jgi:hypothetical protein
MTIHEADAARTQPVRFSSKQKLRTKAACFPPSLPGTCWNASFVRGMVAALTTVE